MFVPKMIKTITIFGLMTLSFSDLYAYNEKEKFENSKGVCFEILLSKTLNIQGIIGLEDKKNDYLHLLSGEVFFVDPNVNYSCKNQLLTYKKTMFKKKDTISAPSLKVMINNIEN